MKKKLKVFIIMYNRLSWSKAMAEYLSDCNCEVILIDNCSTYIPLLKWYERCRYQVIKMPTNLGHRAYWLSGLCNNYNDRYYAVTDHDLDLSNIPIDFKDVLINELELYPKKVKSGFSLEINDLPNNPFANSAKDYEKRFWQTEKTINNFFCSDIDTTFAIYDKKRQSPDFLQSDKFYQALRSPSPYTAKHLLWYITSENITEEEKYYHNQSSTFWKKEYEKNNNSNDLL